MRTGSRPSLRLPIRKGVNRTLSPSISAVLLGGLLMGAFVLLLWSGVPTKANLPVISSLSCHVRGGAWVSAEKALDEPERFPKGAGCYKAG
jgi:hypothetical protein